MTIESDLYQEIILEHYRTRTNRRILDDYTHNAVGDNPLCGDMLTLYIHVKDNTISDLSFQGQGCAICCASANMLCESLRGKSIKESTTLYEMMHCMLTVESGQEQAPLRSLESHFEDFAALEGVRKFPLRIKCALLSWRALEQLLGQIAKPKD